MSVTFSHSRIGCFVQTFDNPAQARAFAATMAGEGYIVKVSG